MTNTTRIQALEDRMDRAFAKIRSLQATLQNILEDEVIDSEDE